MNNDFFLYLIYGLWKNLSLFSVKLVCVIYGINMMFKLKFGLIGY